MTEIIGVRFKTGGKQYYFDPMGMQVPEGTGVIVETGKGLEYGLCVKGNCMVRDEAVVQPLRPLVRLANEADEAQIRRNREKETEAMAVCRRLVEQHKLDMKLVEVQYSFDGSKIIFFFTSEGRVDFRALVRDLAGTFRARIELRQIGVRDEARMVGGLGICGKPFCCNQFLDEFQPVSIKMAKTQSLSLNPTKISGTCGRLMCCLKYEQDAYEDAVKRCPKQESFVECPDGVGTVCSVNLLKEQVKVRLEDSNEQPETYRSTEIRVVRSGKGKRPEDYVAPPKSELEKLRYIPPEGERRLGEADHLAEALRQYLGEEDAPAAEQQSGSHGGRRRNRGGGKKEGQPGKPQQQPRQAKAQPAPQGEAKAAQEKGGQESGQPAGEKSQHRRSRHRPRHRGGGKKPDPGRTATPPAE